MIDEIYIGPDSIWIAKFQKCGGFFFLFFRILPWFFIISLLFRILNASNSRFLAGRYNPWRRWWLLPEPCLLLNKMGSLSHLRFLLLNLLVEFFLSWKISHTRILKLLLIFVVLARYIFLVILRVILRCFWFSMGLLLKIVLCAIRQVR